MADGQRLRWWQNEEEQTLTAREASERVAVAPSPLLLEEVASYSDTAVHSETETDTWTELEAEALRRSQGKTEESESVSFYTDKNAMLDRYRRYRRVTSPFLIGLMLMNFLLAAFMAYQISSLSQMYRLAGEHISLPFLVLLTPLISVIGGFAMTPRFVFWHADRSIEWQQNSVEPAVRLSPQGIHLCTPIYRNVFVSWSDIVSVRLKSSGKLRYVEVRADKKRRFAISTLHLPVTAEVLASRIADYRATREIV